MAKISLRAYIREIENLIDRGQTEEALAHCKYILKFFPKDIEAYRVLGKAYLESQRYSEAADVLQRVLSVFPDDFVSQIGMSIIREDEGNLDAAIWHMEHAFEVQPSNSAVQDELRRLYGRRDGVEPPKVRLTRGALARLYGKGELYPQAIAEVKAALAEDPERIDLEVVLAQMYYLSGHKVEATEVCSKLVAKLPFCYEANRILSEILPETTHSDDAKTYQQRIFSLDPYSAYVSSAAPTIAQVPDNAVSLDHLDWQPTQEGEAQPEWAKAVGAELTPEEGSLPDWLSSIPQPPAGPSAPETKVESVEPEPQVESTPFSPIPAAEEAPAESALIPDWMKSAGWTSSSGETPEETPPPTEPAEPVETAEGDLAEAEIPDWLQSIAPAAIPKEEPVAEEEQEKLDLLDKILPQAPEKSAEPEASITSEVESQPDQVSGTFENREEISPTPSEEVPDWLKDIRPVSETEPPQRVDQAIPDWMQEETPAAEEQAAVSGAEEELPSWLEGPGQTPMQEQREQTPIQEPPAVSEIKPEEEPLPDWLQGINEAVTPPSAELETTSGESIEEAPAGEVEIATPSPEAELPGPEPTETQAETLPVSEVAQEAAIPTPEAELPASEMPEAQAETPPVVEATAENVIPTAEETEIPAPDIHEAQAETMPAGAVAESMAPPTGPEDIDAAVAWLESLAARQGADEETLSTPPEKRMDTPPDWIKQQMGAVSEQPEVSEVTSAEESPQAAEALETPQAEVQPVEGALPEAETELPTEPVEEITPPIEEIPQDPEAAGELEEEMPTWMFGEKPEPVQEALESPEALAGDQLEPVQGEKPEIEIPEQVSEAESLPDWLRSAESIDETEVVPEPIGQQPEELPEPITLEAPEEPVEEVPHVEDETSLPTWLQELDKQKAEQEPADGGMPASVSADKTLPAWLQGLEASEAVETPVSPVSPEEEKPEKELPDWLQGIEETPSPEVPVASVPAELTGAEEETPQWLHEIEARTEAVESESAAVEEEFPEWLAGETEPVAESDLARLDELPPIEPTPAWMNEVEEAPAQPEEIVPESIIPPIAEPEIEHPVSYEGVMPAEETILAEPEAVIPPPDEPEEVLANIIRPVDIGDSNAVLEAAQDFLHKGELTEALEEYSLLISNGELLEEVVHDLRDALYRFPVDTSLWQMLGDAFVRNNRLQDALDAYTKAEELLR